MRLPMLSWLFAVADGRKVLLPSVTLPDPVVRFGDEEAPIAMLLYPLVRLKPDWNPKSVLLFGLVQLVPAKYPAP